MSENQKCYIGAQELLELSYELGQKIIKDGFCPTYIIGIWRGGAPVGIAIQELYKYMNITTDHISIRTSSYVGTNQQSEIRVHGLEYIIDNANMTDSILLVDDIFDSGRSIKAILIKLKQKMRNNLPQDIRVATVLYKRENNKTDIVPDYYVSETNKWIIFPHEIEGMSIDEIQKNKGNKIAEIIELLK